MLTGCSSKADLVFAIDASGSIRQERFPTVLEFCQKIVDQLEIASDRTRVGALSWSDNERLNFNLNKYTHKQDVRQALGYIQFMAGKTHTASALRRMHTSMFKQTNGDRPDIPSYAIVITDGNSNINKDNTIGEAVEARVSGVHIITVSVGKQLGTFELKSMASQPKDKNMFQVERFDELDSLVRQMPMAFCNGR